MKKILLGLMTVFMVGCSSTEIVKEGSNLPKISVVSTNAVGGKLEEGIGYARLLTIIKKQEKEFGRGGTFYLDAGGNFLASGDVQSGKLRKVLTSSRLKATTLASGDFQKGLGILEETMETGNFHILASNVKYVDGRDFLSPYLIEEVNGKKVGIIGIVSPDLYNELTEDGKLKIKIEDPFTAIPPLVRGLKTHGVDFIIALSSLGKVETKGSFGIDDLVAKNREINLVIDGSLKNLHQEKKTILIGEEPEMNSIGLTEVIIGEDGANLINYEKIEAQNLILEEEIIEEKQENLEVDPEVQTNLNEAQEKLETETAIEVSPDLNLEGNLVKKYKIEKDGGLENLINLLKK